MTHSDAMPEWFIAFLWHRQQRNPSAQTVTAYCRDFAAIARLVSGANWARMAVVDITTPSMQDAFAVYARHHGDASIRRCWSTWNLLCDFLWINKQLAVNPMPSIDRPRLTTPVPWSAVRQFGGITAPT